MTPKYPPARLRRFIDQRDSARAALDIASTRLKQASADDNTAIRLISEFEAANLDLRTENDAAKAEASLARLKAQRRGTSEAVTDAIQARDEAAEIVSITASLVNAGMEFAAANGWSLPSDIRERA